MSLYRLVLALILLFASVIVAARLVGSRRLPPLAMVLTNADGSACPPPCMFGVRPGETKFADVIALLALHPLTHHFKVTSTDPLTLEDPHAPGAFIGLTPTTDGLVDVMIVSNGNLLTAKLASAPDPLFQNATFGDVIADFGGPYRIARFDTSVFLNYIDARLNIRILVNPPSVEPFFTPVDPVHSIIAFSIHDCRTNVEHFTPAPWLGFTTTTRNDKASTISTNFVRTVWPDDISHYMATACQP